MSGGGGDETTQVTQVEPPAFARKALTDLVRTGGVLFGQGGFQAPEREAILQGFTPEEVAAQQQALQAAGLQQGVAGTAAGSLQEALNLPGNIIQRPEVAAAISAAQRPILEQLTEQALPGISAGALGAGQVGGSRQGIAEGLAIQGAQDASALASAQIASDALRTASQARSQALFATPQIQQALLAPSITQATVGRDIRELGQAQAQEAQDIEAINQLAQADALQAYAQLLAPLLGGFSDTTQTISGARTGPSRGQAAAGGALSGASVGSSFGPYGALIGALLGGAGGAASA